MIIFFFNLCNFKTNKPTKKKNGAKYMVSLPFKIYISPKSVYIGSIGNNYRDQM